MNDFTLSKPPERVWPAEITLGGRSYAVNAGHRTVLKILRLLQDDGVADRHKLLLLSRLFYPGVAPDDPLDGFLQFLGTDDGEAEAADEPVLDVEQDAAEIYASFLQQYGIDLMAAELPYKRFAALLGELGPDTPIGRKIALRMLDLADVDPKHRGEAAKRKRRVQLRRKENPREAALRQQALDLLERGESPESALRKLRKITEGRRGP